MDLPLVESSRRRAIFVVRNLRFLNQSDAIHEADSASAKLDFKRNPVADAALEQRRLQLSIDDYVLTDDYAYTEANGMGGIDQETDSIVERCESQNLRNY